MPSGKFAGSGLRYSVQTDSAEVPSGWRLNACRRLRARRRRSAGASLLHTTKREH